MDTLERVMILIDGSGHHVHNTKEPGRGRYT